MKITVPFPDIGDEPRAPSWFDRPLSEWWCFAGWLVASALFIGLTRLLGGTTLSDAPQSVYSTWAIAHGDLACAYLTKNPYSASSIAPLWPLLSGGLAAVAGIGHNVPFPPHSALGPNCAKAPVAIFRWWVAAKAIWYTARIGYVTWLPLMAGIVGVIRAAGRGRRLWEPVVLLITASSAPVLFCLTEDFHPQDLVALGLCLGALAFVLRDRWIWAGVLLGLALMSQQFALLVFVPLVVVTPKNRRVVFIGSAFASASLIALPMIVLTAGRAFGAVVLGTGATPATGGTVLWELRLHGPVLVAASRGLPIILAGALAWWSVRRLGQTALSPVPLLSLVATSLSLRLVFEQSLFGYYLMAVTVSLVVLYVLCGRIRWYLVAWLVLLTIDLNPFHWQFDSVGSALPLWLWQVILVPAAVGFAIAPLMSALQGDQADNRTSVQEGATLVTALV